MNRVRIVLISILTIAALSLRAQVSTDYQISMSDGIILNATLVTPSTAPPQNGFPAVVFIHGLGGKKADLTMISTLISGRGFACLLYDVRGQGSSGGLSTIMGERETQDLREVLAFLQSLPNLNPQVIGVAGGSQGGVHAWLAAMHHMPGVQTIATLVAPPSYSLDLFPAECIKQQLRFELSLSSVRYDPLRDRLRAFVIQEQYDSVRTFILSRDITPLVDSVRIPVIQSLGWGDVLFHVNSALRAAQNLSARSVPVWSYFGTNGHGEAIHVPEYLFVVETMLAWFGYWLQGVPLENAQAPRIILADDRPAWPHTEVTTWPPPDAGTVRLYFNCGSLQTSPPAAEARHGFSIQYDSSYLPLQGWDQSYAGTAFRNAFQATPVRFVSPPLLDSMNAAGIPEARLFLRGNAARFQAHLRVFDVAETDSGSTWSLVSRCTNGVRGAAAGTVVEKQIEGQAFAHHFPAGHRIGIEVSPLDMYDANRAHIIPYFQSASAELVSSPLYPSHIDLPLIGAARFTNVAASPAESPAAFTLSQNYPNPFNPSTTLAFTLHREQHVTMEVYSITGQRIATLLDGVMPRGEHRVAFHARDLASGMYVARLTSGTMSRAVSMLLVR